MLKKIFCLTKLKILSSLACFALLITSFASNQCCWFIMYDEELPDASKRLKKYNYEDI